MKPSLRTPARQVLLGAVFLVASGIPGVFASNPPKRASGSWTVLLTPTQVVNGAPVLVRVTSPVGLKSMSGKWLEHQIFFTYDPTTKSWYGIAGVSLETRPGSYPLLLNGTTRSGSEGSFQKEIGIHKGKYRSIAVTVAKRFTAPSPEQLQEINQEKTVKQDLFRRVSAEREWYGAFQAPLAAPVSDVFGTRRVFNGKIQSTHQGLDYAV